MKIDPVVNRLEKIRHVHIFQELEAPNVGRASGWAYKGVELVHQCLWIWESMSVTMSVLVCQFLRCVLAYAKRVRGRESVKIFHQPCISNLDCVFALPPRP
jgi:hypothetical protein